jgi:hypothetical protein
MNIDLLGLSQSSEKAGQWIGIKFSHQITEARLVDGHVRETRIFNDEW